MEIKDLSKSEQRVARMVAQGYEDKIIADKLFNSPHTIRTHVKRIKQKMNLNNRVQLAVKYIQSLENPKEFALTMTLVGVQFLAIFASPDMDLRRPRARRSRVKQEAIA